MSIYLNPFFRSRLRSPHLSRIALTNLCHERYSAFCTKPADRSSPLICLAVEFFSALRCRPLNGKRLEVCWRVHQRISMTEYGESFAQFSYIFFWNPKIFACLDAFRYPRFIYFRGLEVQQSCGTPTAGHFSLCWPTSPFKWLDKWPFAPYPSPPPGHYRMFPSFCSRQLFVFFFNIFQSSRFVHAAKRDTGRGLVERRDAVGLLGTGRPVRARGLCGFAGPASHAPRDTPTPRNFPAMTHPRRLLISSFLYKNHNPKTNVGSHYRGLQKRWNNFKRFNTW